MSTTDKIYLIHLRNQKNLFNNPEESTGEPNESTGEPTYQEHVEPKELVGLETYE